MKVAAVLGVGPGLGAAIARRFAGEGFAVALMAAGNTRFARHHRRPDQQTKDARDVTRPRGAHPALP